ncbi:MICAL-like protein 2a [Nerophis ophidion]|uniref:MICAL-like protein 2a n=1 Tax=Nerophis ophidion TaxID=159077 RepID=UPI002ADFEFDB|nr:MICAL-like protein 2a [Nerophis ophidion]
MSAIQALERWCRCACEDYRDVSISNMTSSFRSGLAFCALIHRHRPDLIDYESLRKEDVFDNNKLAFQVAEEKLGIPALLDAEDMVSLRIPDRLSILTYVSQYYNYFKGRSPSENTTVGGAKKAAGGSKDTPSEKKNLPVAVKTKTSIKTPAPPTVAATRTSPKLAITAAQNKNGTLNSKCAACRSHVHLVQRHFAEGKLFHRSCFICCECSGTLHAGGYKPGKDPDTFVCKVHKEKSTKRSSEARIKTELGPSNGSIRLEPQPCSVVNPVHADPPTHCWTSSARKTQAARRSFLLEASTAGTAELSGRPEVDWSRAGKNPAEQNSNNNNKRLFSVRSADKRFFASDLSENTSLQMVDCRKNVERTNREESPCPPVLIRDNMTQATAAKGKKTHFLELFTYASYNRFFHSRPCTLHRDNKDDGEKTLSKVSHVNKTARKTAHPEAAVRKRLEDGPLCETQSKPKPLESEPEPRDDESTKGDQFISTTFSNMCAGESESHPPPITFPLARHGPPADAPRRPSPVKSPARRPAVESISSPNSQADIPSGAKKGKYLSPTDAFRTEMRSPSSYHIPAEQIESELSDIQASVAGLEREGVELERRLRRCENEGEGDVLMDPLMVDWFKVIRKKQVFIRRESELVYIARTQQLEQQQPRVEQELRRLLEKPDHLKTSEERAREKALMRRLVEIVDGRNAIVEVLDDDRLREVAEDEQLNAMMKNLGVKKGKPKRKSSLSKLFSRRSKRRVE